MISQSGATSKVISAENVTVDYGAEPVLIDVDLDVTDGELIGIVGPSGSGKSTLLKVLLGTVPVRAGKVDRRPGLAVGLVPQVEHIDWSYPVTVAECVGMARARGLRTPWITKVERAEIHAVLDRLGLNGLANRHIRDLSGGQQQRLCIARAIATAPEVLLMDEPCSALDPIATAQVEELIDELRQSYSVVIVTHSMQQAARVSQRTAFFHLGNLVEYGETDKIFTNPEDPRTESYISGRIG